MYYIKELDHVIFKTALWKLLKVNLLKVLSAEQLTCC